MCIILIGGHRLLLLVTFHICSNYYFKQTARIDEKLNHTFQVAGVIHQKQLQKLSPLQIQTIKLLELPTLELEQKIKKELEENPVLDENTDSHDADEAPKNVSLSEYPTDDPTPSYKLYVNNHGKDERPQYSTFSVRESFHQSLEMQLGYRQMDDREKAIALFVIGSLDDDGYLRRDLEALADDISFRLNIETNEQELERILGVIQEFEPIGIGARNLQECLYIELISYSTSAYSEQHKHRTHLRRVSRECYFRDREEKEAE